MQKDEKKNENTDLSPDDFGKMLEDYKLKAPQAGDLVTGEVISASKAEVKLDIDGVMTGVVRGPELYEEDDDYAGLKPGDTVEATVLEPENENGELELSFKYAGQEKAWEGLREAHENKTALKVKIVDANKGGLLAKYRQISGFLPVSQLAPENYPRVNGGDKGKILEKLRSFAGQEFEVKVMTLDEKDDKIIFSEKEAWSEKQKDIISKYKVGTVIEGSITAITDFGIFVSFGENLEGLIHISELAWQRIEDPAELYKVGDTIRAEVISLSDSKIFLSAKKLLKDPWEDVGEKFKIGEKVEGSIIKINPFGLFVKLDEDIHGLAHISQLDLTPKEKINEKFRAGENKIFTIVSIEAKEHRLGLAYTDKDNEAKAKKAKKEEKKEDKGEVRSEKLEEDEKKIEKKDKEKAVKKTEDKDEKKTAKTKKKSPEKKTTKKKSKE